MRVVEHQRIVHRSHDSPKMVLLSIHDHQEALISLRRAFRGAPRRLTVTTAALLSLLNYESNRWVILQSRKSLVVFCSTNFLTEYCYNLVDCLEPAVNFLILAAALGWAAGSHKIGHLLEDFTSPKLKERYLLSSLELSRSLLKWINATYLSLSSQSQSPPRNIPLSLIRGSFFAGADLMLSSENEQSLYELYILDNFRNLLQTFFFLVLYTHYQLNRTDLTAPAQQHDSNTQSCLSLILPSIQTSVYASTINFRPCFRLPQSDTAFYFHIKIVIIQLGKVSSGLLREESRAQTQKCIF